MKFLRLMLSLLLLLFLLATASHAQSQQLLMSTSSPPAVTNTGATYSGQPPIGLGVPIYYWVVVHYPSGVVYPSLAGVAQGTPGIAALSNTNTVTINWTPMPGATTYD